jgi:C4-dicarboxylate transporter DctQ subunit
MWSRIITKLEEGIISLLLASMTLLVFYEVILRFVFNEGLLWAEELTLLLSAWMVLFGASYGVKVGSHIGVDALIRNLPSKVARVVSSIAVLGALVYCGIYLKGSWVYLDKMHQIGLEMEDLPMPRWVAHSILIIGFSLLAWRLVHLLWMIIRGDATTFKLMDEAKKTIDELAKEQEEMEKEQAKDTP